MKFSRLHKTKLFIFSLLAILVIITLFLIFKPLPFFKSPNKIYNQDSFRKYNYPYLNKSLPVEERVDDLLGRMTTSEKIGQLALVEKNSIHDPLDIVRYGLGSVMSGFGAKTGT